MAESATYLLYLDNFAEADLKKADTDAENAASLLGSYSNLSIDAVTFDDVKEHGIAYDNQFRENESFSYDIGIGPVSTLLDSSMPFNTSVTLGDGSTKTLHLLVIQTQASEIFVRDIICHDSLDNLNTQRISLNTVDNSNGAGFTINESVENSSVACCPTGTRLGTPAGA